MPIRLRFLVPALVVAALCLELLAAARHPTTRVDAWTAVAAGAATLVALGAATCWAGWRPAPHRDTPARVLGIRAGVALGLLWVVEIGVNNVFPADRVPVGTRDVIDDVIWALIYVITLGIAGVASRRAGGVADGARIGLWSGIVSGLFAYLAGLLVVTLFLGALERDPELIAGFPASGYPDLATDATYAMIATAPLAGHLWLLGIAAGTLFGALGGLVGTLTARTGGAPR